MKINSTRRIMIASAIGIGSLSVGIGGAAAFEPPADPNDNFTCEDGPVAGHPGVDGLAKAMMNASSMTAWSASMNAAPVDTCG